ncbi:transposase [Streptomyces sp. NPDC056112]|uniref:transposase n=1 Tax=Streptomyces sp. NPDC056112 TaxID=3345715 RepID=UPI0035E1B198
MARRGRRRRLELEAAYWRLLAAGVGTVEACKQLGIGRKTGYRWRAENGGLQPDYLPERSRSGRYLSLPERRRIASLCERGLTIREIAARLGRAPSTVSRELRRDSRPHGNGAYDADLAHHRCRERAGRPRRAKPAVDPELRAEVQAKLDQEWSPEQIAAHLRCRRPDHPERERHLCHESIYRALYQGAKSGLSRTLTRKLRTGRPLRKQRRRPDQRMPRFVAPAVLIDHRPPSSNCVSVSGTGKATWSSASAASPPSPPSSTAAPAVSA